MSFAGAALISATLHLVLRLLFPERRGVIGAEEAPTPDAGRHVSEAAEVAERA